MRESKSEERARSHSPVFDDYKGKKTWAKGNCTRKKRQKVRKGKGQNWLSSTGTL